MRDYSIAQNEIRVVGGGKRGLAPFELWIGDGHTATRILFIKNKATAVADLSEVSFPDLDDLPRSLPTMLKEFFPVRPQTRVPPEDFDYLVVSSLLRALRPLLRARSQPIITSIEIVPSPRPE